MKLRSSITADMKFRKSVGAPMVMPSIIGTSRSRSDGHTEDATYTREHALHFWPWYS